MPARARQKSPQVQFSPVDLIANEALTRISARTKPIDLQPDNPIGWIEDHFRIPREEREDMRIILYPYHKVALSHALSRDERGLFKYSLVLWSDIKKSIKSTIAAAVLLWRAWHTDYGQFYVIANTKDQADSRVAYYLRRAIELNPELKRQCNVNYSTHTVTLPNRSFIKAIPVNAAGEAGANPTMVEITELWGATSKEAQRMWCFDDQTEILTLQGWRTHNDMTLVDDVACFNLDTEQIEWHKPKAIYRDQYNGEMHLYENKTFSHCVTPNHRLLGWYSKHATKKHLESRKERSDRKAHSGFMVSEDMRKEFSSFQPRMSVNGYASFPTPINKIFGPTKFKQGYEVSWEDWCEYAGWFVSEGYVRHNKDKQGHLYPTQVSISQEPKIHRSKWNEIKLLHDRMFSSSVGYTISDKNKSFVVHSSVMAQECLRMGNSSSTKRIPIEIKNSDPLSLMKFLRAYLLGDGTITQSGVFSATTWSKGLADDLMEVGIRLGYTMSVNESKKTSSWRVHFGNGGDGYTRLLEKRSGAWKTIDYHGIVWCPSTKTGAVVTRRNGKVCISGNTETTLPPALLGKAQRWIDTYAGFEGESIILEQLYDMGVTQGVKVDPEYDFMYENRPARMFTMWNQIPRLPWQSPEYYASEERTLLSMEFLRVHRNQWSSGSERFVPKEWIDACKGTIPAYNNEPCVASLDGALTDDSFALVVMDKEGEFTRVRYARAWYPPIGGQIDFVGSLGDPGPELEVERLMKTYNIIEWCYDRTHIADMMARLNRRLGIHIYDFSQGELRLVADSMFRHSIRDKTFIHSGELDLTSHLDNANAKVTKMADASGNSGQVRETLRIVKRNQKLKIDAAVAASMANYELREAYNIS